MSKVASRCYDDDKPVCLFTPAIKTKNWSDNCFTNANFLIASRR